MKKKKKKKTPFFYQNYPLPFVSEDGKGAGAVVGTKAGGALAAGKPPVSK
jgi:hypothetical protein